MTFETKPAGKSFSRFATFSSNPAPWRWKRLPTVAGRPFAFRCQILVCLSCLLLASPLSAQDKTDEPADTLVLKGGRKLNAKVIAPEEQVEINGKTRTTVVLETPAGGKLKLERGKVVSDVKLTSDELAAYREFSASLSDTVADHWKAVEWCREQPSGKLKLANQITFHLRRIVSLDENEEKAQRALGNENVNGRWVNEELFNRTRGYTREGGKWRSQIALQVSEVLESGKSALGDTKDGFGKWKRAISKMSDSEVSSQQVAAVRELQQLLTPNSISFICQQFDEEKREAVQQVYLEAIATQKNRFALGKLVDVTMTHPRPAIRERALAYLKQFDSDEVALQTISYLGNAENSVVANAGVLLGETESTRAILPLIKHLKTRHTVKNPTAGKEGQIAGNFNNQGGDGLSLGGGGPPTLNIVVENKDVEDALKRITKLNLGTNQADWMAWYIQNHTLNELNLREDD
jgi:hypothetical protein